MWFQQSNPCVDNLPWKIGQGQASNYGFAPRSQRLVSNNRSCNRLLWKQDESRTFSSSSPSSFSCLEAVFSLYFFCPRHLVFSVFLFDVNIADTVAQGCITPMLGEACWQISADLKLVGIMTNKCLWTSACHLMLWALSQHVCFSCLSVWSSVGNHFSSYSFPWLADFVVLLGQCCYIMVVFHQLQQMVHVLAWLSVSVLYLSADIWS